MMRILVIGNGFLGSHVYNELKSNNIPSCVTSFQSKSNDAIFLDIANAQSIYDCFKQIKPTIVINCAALTDLDTIEKNSYQAYLVNAEAVKNISKIVNKLNIRLIQISTDSVFDGIRGMYDETDPPNPINEYAKSKLLGEQYVQEYCSNHLIIRTNFYGYNNEGKNLFNWILSNLQNNVVISGFHDVIFNPLDISTLSKMIIESSLTDHTGLYHFSSDESFSKYQFALKIAEHLGKNKDLINSDSINNFNFVAKRPLNTTLKNKKSKQIISTSIIPFEDWLKQNIPTKN